MTLSSPTSLDRLDNPPHAQLHQEAYDLVRLLGVSWVNVKDSQFGAKGDGVTDDTVAIKAAIAYAVALGGAIVFFPPGTYQVSDELILSSDLSIWLAGPATMIRMTVANKTTFRATSMDGIHIVGNGGSLFGEGAAYQGTGDPAPWTSNVTNANHRGIQLFGCTRVTIDRLVLQNHANAAIAVNGGSRIKILNCIIEGTHQYSKVLLQGDNFQNGILVQNTAADGNYDDVTIVSPDISFVHQGILTGETVGTAGTLNIIGANIHDIIGQHGLYIASSNVSVAGATIDSPGLSGVKVQAAATIPLVENVTLTGITVRNATNSQAFDFESSGGGEVRNLNATGLTMKNCQRGVTISGLVTKGRVSDVSINTTTQHGVLVSGVGVDDMTISGLTVVDAAQNGVLVQASGGGRVRFRDVFIREPNTTNGANFGFRNNCTASTALDTQIDGLEIRDANGQMPNGLYHQGGTMRVYGRVAISGASSASVRCDTSILEWPTGADVGDSYNGMQHIRFSGRTDWAVRSTSTSDVTLWEQILDDESAYLVEASISGKTLGSAERGTKIAAVTAFRNATTATVQSASTLSSNMVSAGFTGAYSWDTTGNNLRLRVNSGAASTYDWRGFVTVTKVVV